MMIKRHTIVACLSLAALFTSGCSSNDTASSASRATATQLITSSMNSSGDPEAIELILKEPEVQKRIDCVATHLSSQDWGDEQHQMYMEASGTASNTTSTKYSEDEYVKHFGSISTAMAGCM